MSGQTTLSFYQLVIVTLLPALIAGAVGVLSPLVVEWRRYKIARKDTRSEKLQEIIDVLYEYDYWLELHRDKYVLGKAVEMNMAPQGKLRILVSIYFPDFESEMQKFMKGVLAYQKWSLAAGQKRLNSGQITTDGFELAYEQYRDAFQQFVERICREARSTT